MRSSGVLLLPFASALFLLSNAAFFYRFDVVGNQAASKTRGAEGASATQHILRGDAVAVLRRPSRRDRPSSILTGGAALPPRPDGAGPAAPRAVDISPPLLLGLVDLATLVLPRPSLLLDLATLVLPILTFLAPIPLLVATWRSRSCGRHVWEADFGRISAEGRTPADGTRDQSEPDSLTMPPLRFTSQAIQCFLWGLFALGVRGGAVVGGSESPRPSQPGGCYCQKGLVGIFSWGGRGRGDADGKGGARMWGEGLGGRTWKWGEGCKTMDVGTWTCGRAVRTPSRTVIIAGSGSLYVVLAWSNVVEQSSCFPVMSSLTIILPASLFRSWASCTWTIILPPSSGLGRPVRGP